jgi:hypothetical protein
MVPKVSKCSFSENHWRAVLCWLRLQTGRWAAMDADLTFLQQQRGTPLRIWD